MGEALALIDKIIEEHKLIAKEIRTVEQTVNDLEAGSKLEGAKEDFLPGKLDDQKRSVQNLQQSLETIAQGIEAHFDREETGLLAAFEEHGGKMLASALRALLTEHEELRNRLAKLRRDMAELTVGSLSREVWEGKAWGVRVYTGSTRQLLDAHAQSEQELLLMLRNRLRREIKESGRSER